jgi:hypothetical protein
MEGHGTQEEYIEGNNCFNQTPGISKIREKMTPAFFR